MFWHNFKYSLKTLFKDKALIFWTFMFPIILGTLFSLAFSDIENNEKLKVIDVAVVMEKENMIYKSVFDTLSEDGEGKIFNTVYVSEEEARELLSNDKISGYVVVQDEVRVVVNNSDVNETVIKYTVEEIMSSEAIISNVLNMKDLSQVDVDLSVYLRSVYNEVLSKINRENNIVDISSSNLSYTMIEYYTLIAMSALYGGILGMVSILKCLANMGSKGARVAVSPCKKRELVASSLLSGYIVQLLGLFLLFIFTVFVLNVDYGDNILLVILTALVGSFTGLSLGVFVGSALKSSENTKVGILIAFTMMGSFLSGMMGITMKYIIDSNVPFVNKINPAALITDALYSLYYYEGFTRFYTNIGILCLISFVLMGTSVILLRRQRYDSI